MKIMKCSNCGAECYGTVCTQCGMNFETHKIELLPTAAQTNSATPPLHLIRKIMHFQLIRVM